MGKTVLVLPLIILLLFAASVSGMEVNPSESISCMNTTHLLRVTEIRNSSDNSCMTCTKNMVQCPYGCDSARKQCTPYYGSGMDSPVPLEVVLFFEGMGFIMLIGGFIKTDNMFFPLLSFMVFIILALVGNNIMPIFHEDAIASPVIVWMNYGLAFLCLMYIMVAYVIGAYKGVVGGEKA